MSNTIPNADSQAVYPPPDVRQSLAHTMLAASFVLIVVQNPAAGFEIHRYMWIIVGLCVLVSISWYFMARRLRLWIGQSDEIKKHVQLGARLDRNRAVSHALMSLLAISLSIFSGLGRLAMAELQPDAGIVPYREILFYADGVVALASSTVFARCVRDFLKQQKHSKRSVIS